MNAARTAPVSASMQFETKLCAIDTKWHSGYAGGNGMDVHKVADEALGGVVPGPWLTCYMIARFGWPNTGCDPYKNLCSWMLTTPMEGLYLSVTPYLGGGGNYHFAIRFTEEIGEELDRDPGREAFVRRRDEAVRAWWKEHGSKIYAIGEGLKDGDEDEIVHIYGEQDGIVAGLWRLPLKVDRPPEDLPEMPMFTWWLSDIISKHHPEADIPSRMNDQERADRGPTDFQRRAAEAVKAAIVDLLRPTRVRDIDFNIFGRPEKSTKAQETIEGRTPTERWEGTGYAAEYWFTTVSAKKAETA